MSKKDLNPDKIKEDFQTRFMEVLCMRPVAWWSEELGVVPSLINARWKKGSFPNADNLIKICNLSGISANWLLLGIGPKHIESKEMDEDTRRSLQNYITTLEDKYEEALQQNEKIIHDVEILKRLKWFSDTFETHPDHSTAEQLNKLSGEEMFNRVFVPKFMFLKMLTDILFKAMEMCALSENGPMMLSNIINWIKTNYEKNLYHAKGSLVDLESLFNIPELQKLFSDNSEGTTIHE